MRQAVFGPGKRATFIRDFALGGAAAAVAAVSLVYALAVYGQPEPTTPAEAAPGPAEEFPPGPIRSAADIPPELQAILMQADAPTHDRPTPWGLFVINPVINGEGILNPQTSPLPYFDGADVTRVEAYGKDALEEVRAEGGIALEETSIDIPLLAAVFFREGDKYWSRTFYGEGDGTPDYRSLVLETFTPTEPVVFDEFPDNAIRDFRKSERVAGHPTLTVFPDPNTADPRMERVVAWSQGDAVFFVRTTGIFTDDEVISIAQSLAKAQG